MRNRTTTPHKHLRMPVKMRGYRIEADGCVIYVEKMPGGTRVEVVPEGRKVEGFNSTAFTRTVQNVNDELSWIIGVHKTPT